MSIVIFTDQHPLLFLQISRGAKVGVLDVLGFFKNQNLKKFGFGVFLKIAHSCTIIFITLI